MLPNSRHIQHVAATFEQGARRYKSSPFLSGISSCFLRISSTMVSPHNDSSTKASTSARQLPIDSFACPPLRNPATQDVFQSIVKGRKSWKSLKGGEIVWPPELEAALIEGELEHVPWASQTDPSSESRVHFPGLENYQPDDSRETRLLGRFPMRNRFISDWIFEKTGKRRTAKQVGSRLQQLRDTCGGKKRTYFPTLLDHIRAAIRRSHR